MRNRDYVLAFVLFSGILSLHQALALPENRPYIFGNIGSSANTDYSFTDVEAKSPLISNETNYVAYRLGLGYQIFLSEQFSLGAELAYNYYGDEQYNFYNKDQAKVSFTANDILFVASYFFTSQWEIHAKSGVAYEEVLVTENFIGANYTEKQWVPEAAAGISYHVNAHWSVHGDFAYLMGWESGITNMPDITVVWLGASYCF